MLGTKAGPSGSEIIIKETSGSTSPERALSILNRQSSTEEEVSRNKTQILLQEKLQDAIRSGNPEEVDKILKMMDNMNSSAITQEYRYLNILNSAHGYVVEIESKPFVGITLTPGSKTKMKRAIPVGIYKLVYNECKIGGSKCKKITVNISIDTHRTRPITIRNK